MSAPAFELSQVQVCAGNKTILKPLTHRFTPCKVTGLIGHNGSGKSTLIKILSRQQPTFTGKLLWNEKPISQWSARSFAQQVAYLPQQLPLAEGMTVKELVSLGRYAWHGPLGRLSSTDKNAVLTAIKSVDLLWAQDYLVEQLSGGERQRAWLAMCVVQGSQCLLLDEPTSALDIAHQKEILQVIHHLSQRNQLTVIMVLHDLNMAARFCDEFLALRHGEKIFHGSPAQLLTTEQLEQIYQVPMGIVTPPEGGLGISYVK